MTLRGYLSTPYVLTTESLESPDGWIRCAAYPEIPGCEAKSQFALDAIAAVDRLRMRMILTSLDRGEPLPLPRLPIHSLDTEYELRGMGLAHLIEWLDVSVEEARKQGAFKVALG